MGLIEGKGYEEPWGPGDLGKGHFRGWKSDYSD